VNLENLRSRILVVDDNVDALNSMSEILQSEGFDTTCALDGQQAWELMHREPIPDLVVLDLMMPRMDGWTFRMHQRRDPKLAAIPIVVVSAFSTKVIDEGAEAIFSKPVHLPEFIEAVKRGIARRRASS
jgi:two-component system, chemotaxis family, chemotaxis protein CheY